MHKIKACRNQIINIRLISINLKKKEGNKVLTDIKIKSFLMAWGYKELMDHKDYIKVRMGRKLS